MRLTDGQTDGQTDTFLISSPRGYSMQCSKNPFTAVKTVVFPLDLE